MGLSQHITCYVLDDRVRVSNTASLLYTLPDLFTEVLTKAENKNPSRDFLSYWVWGGMRAGFASDSFAKNLAATKLNKVLISVSIILYPK